MSEAERIVKMRGPNLETSRRRTWVVLLAMTIALTFTLPTGALAAAQAAYATAEELDALEIQAAQLDELVRERVRRGRRMGDEIGDELTRIFGDLARLQQIRRRQTGGDGDAVAIPKTDVDELRARIATLRAKLQSESTGPPGTDGATTRSDEVGDGVATAPRSVSVPPGTRVMARLNGWVSSEDARVDDPFEAEAVDDIVVDGEVVIPRGAIFEGHVAEVQKAKRPSRGGELDLAVDRIRHADGSTTVVSATVVGVRYGDELVGEGVDGGDSITKGILGAVLGGLLGGPKGALVGLGVGAGGSLLASKGEEVDLPDGTELRLRFDTGVSVTWRPVGEKR